MGRFLHAFFSPLGLRRAVPQVWDGFQTNIKLMIIAEVLVLVLALLYTAYVTEVYRAGIESVHPSQRMAARSLGLSYAQTLRHVILPQAIRRVVPPLLNDFIGLQKDTAIITVVGVTEALAQAGFYSNDFFSYAGYMVAAIFFVILTIPFARFTDHLIKEREQRERAQLV